MQIVLIPMYPGGFFYDVELQQCFCWIDCMFYWRANAM